ncbi:hypothetical protein [Chitinolyticbacter meiyuanensis]|uniref:hypothetical protein n=1 Tax=Chitinolyticbacter meiyuanensis TaxID=682798 RepID=UPI0011E5C2B0|nr:hypothetical protein [Chitinolyticbacter meiyuanensis]
MDGGGLICVFEDATAPLALGPRERLEPGDVALLAASPALQRTDVAWLPGHTGDEVRCCKCQIPVVTAPGLRVRVLAGRFAGVAGALPWPARCLDAYIATCAVLPLGQGERWRLLYGEVVDEGDGLRALQPSHVLLWSDIVENTDPAGVPVSISYC